MRQITNMRRKNGGACIKSCALYWQCNVNRVSRSDEPGQEFFKRNRCYKAMILTKTLARDQT